MRSEVDLRLKYTHEQPWKLWRCHDAMLLCTRVAVSGLLPWKSQLCPDPTAWTQGTRKGAFIIPARLSVSLDRSRSFSKAVSKACRANSFISTAGDGHLCACRSRAWTVLHITLRSIMNCNCDWNHAANPTRACALEINLEKTLK